MVFGSIKLFRLFGIDVYLHWTWFLLAAFFIPRLADSQFVGTGSEAVLWSTLMFLTLFAVVLMHEFGHALACLSVRGQVKHIVLWPLGGIAYMSPLHRPGAHLWTIVGGPLVNVLLLPVTVVLFLGVGGEISMLEYGVGGAGNLLRFCFMLMVLNALLLLFNMLPIYPLDGGQTLMGILWFFVGRAKALQVVGIIGLIGAASGVLFSVFTLNIWYLLMALFIGFQAWIGYRHGMKLAQLDPKDYDERIAKRVAKDEIEDRIRADIDPWRR